MVEVFWQIPRYHPQNYNVFNIGLSKLLLMFFISRILSIENKIIDFNAAFYVLIKGMPSAYLDYWLNFKHIIRAIIINDLIIFSLFIVRLSSCEIKAKNRIIFSFTQCWSTKFSKRLNQSFILLVRLKVTKTNSLRIILFILLT